MMRKISLIFLGAIAGAGLTLLATQPLTVLVGSSAGAASSDTYRQLNLLGEVFERVRADYVEKPDNSKLVESAINGMLAGLDPHSSYMDPNSFREMQVETRGEFGGLGMEVTMEVGLLKVVAPIDDTPAAGARPDTQSSGRENARPGAHQDQAHHYAQGAGQADRRDYHS
jgi:carboxyl-terminal processing protease